MEKIVEVIEEKDNIEKNEKISFRQSMIFFLFFSICISTRITVKLVGDKSFNGSFIAAALAVIPEFLLLILLFAIMKKYPEKSLPQIIEMVLGKIVGKAVLATYYIFFLCYIAFFVRNFYEKFTISIFTDTPGVFFAAVALLFAVFAARRSIETFARFAEIIFIIVVVVFTISFFIAVFSVDLKNFSPVTTRDSIGILQSTLATFSSWSAVTFVFFFGDNTRKKGSGDTSAAYRIILVAALINFIGLLLTVGIFNAATAQNLAMPFYMIFKTIKTTGIIQSLETFFIMFWVLTDIIAIVFLLFSMQKTSKTLYTLNNEKYFIYPSAFAIFILVFIIGKNQSEIEFFYRYVLNFGSLFFCVLIPAVVFIIGKIRRLL